MNKNNLNTSVKLILVLWVFLVQLSYAQEANVLFVEGNKLYKQENYTEAIDSYQKIIAQEKQSIDVYFNLANAYYRTNKVAQAIYYYEKALQIDVNNKDIQINLGFAKRMTIDNIEELPKNMIQKLSISTIQKLTYNAWAYTAVFFSILFALLFLMYHFSSGSSKKRLFFISSTLSFIFILLSVAFAFQIHAISTSKLEAIVFSQQTEIKNTPTLSGDTVFQLHEGTKVSILDTKDNWKKIRIADGQTGWIIGSELKVL